MPLIEIESDVLFHTETGLRVVREPGIKVSAYMPGTPEPAVFRAPHFDPDAVWAAISAHVAPPPGSLRIATGLEDLCERLARLERRVEMAEQEAADADAVDALVRATEKGVAAADFVGRQLGEIRERLRHVENWQRNRDRERADPEALAIRMGRVERWAKEEMGRWPSEEAADPDAPRRFKCLKPGGSGEWWYGTYYPTTNRWASESTAKSEGNPDAHNVVWIDAKPDPVEVESIGPVS